MVNANSFAQQREADSLKHILTQPISDSTRVTVLVQLTDWYYNANPDSAFQFGQQAITLSKRIHSFLGEIRAMRSLARVLRVQGNLPKALDVSIKAFQTAEKQGIIPEKAGCLFTIGSIYLDLKDYTYAKKYFQQALKLFQSVGNQEQEDLVTLNLEVVYRLNNQLDSARIVCQRIVNRVTATGSLSNKAFMLAEWGTIQFEVGNYQQGIDYERKAIAIYQEKSIYRRLSTVLIATASFFKRLNQPDSSIYYAQRGLAIAQSIGFKREILGASQLLANLYQPKNAARSLAYLNLAMQTNNELFGAANVQSLQRIILAEQERQRALEAQQIAYQNRIEQFGLITGLSLVLLVAGILYRNNRQKHQANLLLAKTLTDLRTTQTQLIQREKMASLGELTAGIAHEIQNPLNFVNNFSEVSVELVSELKDELDRGDTNEAKALADDLSQNLQRITQNGQRASNIVRGMLEHSRTSTGERQPTDLNALCDEYLRLAYQGARVKDSSFSCQLETHFEAALPLVSVLASDMSRVLLNLFNNAFYAVGQKQKTALTDYQPTVSVSTRLVAHSRPERAQSIANPNGVGNGIGGLIEIRVRDNGMGIPDAIKAKIFQPFFTTKPTGEGTGLGLSLSYDIVTKGHGGEMWVESRENTFTEFLVTLPTIR